MNKITFHRVVMLISFIPALILATDNPFDKDQSFAAAQFSTPDGISKPLSSEYTIVYFRATEENKNSFKLTKDSNGDVYFKCDNLEAGFIVFEINDTSYTTEDEIVLGQKSFSREETTLRLYNAKGKIKSKGTLTQSFNIKGDNSAGPNVYKFKFEFDKDKDKIKDRFVELDFHTNDGSKLVEIENITISDKVDGYPAFGRSSGLQFELVNTVKQFIEGDTHGDPSPNKAEKPSQIAVVILGITTGVFLISTIALVFIMKKGSGQSRARGKFKK